MKGLLTFSAAVFFSLGAQAASPIENFKVNVATACAQMSIIADAVIKDTSSDGVRFQLKNNLDDVALTLSSPLPQTYNAIRTGLNSAIDLHVPEHTNATTADRAGVLGFWCVQDTVDAIVNGDHPDLLPQETQAKLIDLFSQTIIDNSTH